MTNILISFSGGLTSAFMSWIAKAEMKYKNLCFVFANTGQEREETLRFVKNVGDYFNIKIHWIESVVNHKNRVATTHKEVSFETACRDSSLFEEMCKKYGIANKAYPHCTRELKQQAIFSFARKYFNGEKYQNAVGIRADEYRRVSEYAQKKYNVIYPLVDRFITKQDVLSFWDEQYFTLGLKDYQGNCKWCWKKSDKKLSYIYNENPEYFDIPDKLEKLYGLSGHNVDGNPRVIFRNNRSTLELIKDCENKKIITLNDSGCSESCEMFPI